MRHAEIAEAPAETGDDILPGGEGREEVRHLLGDLGRGAAGKAGGGEDRGQEQGTQHQQALEEVGPADGGETAEEGVADDDRGGDIHGDIGIQAEDGVEQGAGGLDAGGRINRVSHEEDDGADDLEGMGLGLEAVGQILGNGDGVIRRDGEGPQARRLEDPAEGIADGQADCDPDLTQTQGIDGSRKAHQHPGAHIGSAGGQRGDPGPHFAPAEEVFLFTAVLRTEEEEDTDADHEEEIDNKDDQFCCVVHCITTTFP